MLYPILKVSRNFIYTSVTGICFTVLLSLLSARPNNPAGHLTGTASYTYSKKHLTSLQKAQSRYPILRITLHYFLLFPLLFGYLIVKMLPPKYSFNCFCPFPLNITAINQALTQITMVTIISPSSCLQSSTLTSSLLNDGRWNLLLKT